jgi:tetratricopeptide (TPR) repeat protein
VDLLLEAVDVAGPWRWRWLLTDERTGNPLADHQVNLDPAADQVRAFGDLYGYARSYAAPDRRAADEARIVSRLGAWAGEALLGERVGAAIVAAAPVTVRVAAPLSAGQVLSWPLELAHVGGRPLAARGDVSLVYDVAAGNRPDKAGVGEALRVLAVFSQPTRTSVLALRRERYALSRLIRQVAARQRRMVELQVVQYGVTRDRLARIVDSRDGWDVLHLSGHGSRGLFLLEHPDGSPDPVDIASLVRLLSPARPRLKLSVVSACESAAAATAQALRLIGLADQADQLEADSEAATGTAGLAQSLVAELDCAVVAMRYPVDDEFAIAFAADLYDRILGREQRVDLAVARAATSASGPEPSAGRPAMSLVTPAIFGARAAGLTIPVPRGRPRFDPDQTPTAYFPPEPVRFVGRAQAMAQASAVAVGPEVRAAAADHLAAFWYEVHRQAVEQDGGEDSSLVVRAGLAAAPYLLRLGDWDTASILLDDAIRRDKSPRVLQAALPTLRRIAAVTGDPGDLLVLARALRDTDPAEAEPLLRDALRATIGDGDYEQASSVAAELANLLTVTGRLGEALEVAGHKAEYTEQGGLGPWTRLGDEARRLQILGLMGEHEQVLAETGVLRTQMGELPVRPAENDETISPWNVREVILDIGHTSALALGRWQQCLDLNADILASNQERGVDLHELTRTRFNDADPLIRMGRVDEAGRLLRECQQVFEDHRDTTNLAKVFSERATLENALGRPQVAADFERTALRLSYARPEPRDTAISHHNLAIYLRETGGNRVGQRAHRLAAALIFQLTGMTHDLTAAQRSLAAELRQESGTDTGTGPLPATLAEVIRVAELTDGVRLGELIAALAPSSQAAEAALADILRAAASPPPE